MLEGSVQLDDWVLDILADPLFKTKKNINKFNSLHGIIDARISLKNTFGYENWLNGQIEYEAWYKQQAGYESGEVAYLDEISYDREVYQHFFLDSPILDVGGGVGTLREFLPQSTKYISIDPFIDIFDNIAHEKKKAYSCLSKPINFLSANAEFLPFLPHTFKVVHMRSMLDHVQVPDLAILEAFRVLKKDGTLLIGMSIEGPLYGDSKSSKGKIYLHKRRIIDLLEGARILKRPHDHHTWHPTLENLRKLVTDNGFKIDKEFWQTKWQGRVVYMSCLKTIN